MARALFRYGAVAAVLLASGAGIWWRGTGYRTDVGLGIAAAGLAAFAAALVASRVRTRRR